MYIYIPMFTYTTSAMLHLSLLRTHATFVVIYIFIYCICNMLTSDGSVVSFQKTAVAVLASVVIFLKTAVAVLMQLC